MSLHDLTRFLDDVGDRLDPGAAYASLDLVTPLLEELGFETYKLHVAVVYGRAYAESADARPYGKFNLYELGTDAHAGPILAAIDRWALACLPPEALVVRGFADVEVARDAPAVRIRYEERPTHEGDAGTSDAADVPALGALCDYLAGLGAARLTLTYHGSEDSGCLLPPRVVDAEGRAVAFDALALGALADALYDALLHGEHADGGGYYTEINEGSQGEFEVDVADRTCIRTVLYGRYNDDDYRPTVLTLGDWPAKYKKRFGYEE